MGDSLEIINIILWIKQEFKVAALVLKIDGKIITQKDYLKKVTDFV